MKRIQAWRSSGRFFEHQGHSIFFRNQGEGPPLLCIHGFPTSSWDWHRVWDRLADRFNVSAADMLGFGFSDKPRSHDYTITSQADLQESLLSRLGINECHVLAHDYGVSVAQELLARRIDDPERRPRILSVCFFNGGLFPGEHRPLAIQRLLLSPLGPLLSRLLTAGLFRRNFRKIFAARTQPTREELDEFWSLIQHNQGARIAYRVNRYMRERERMRDRWVGALVNSPVPLQHINGADDPISGRHIADVYRATVPNPALVLLEGVGHYPQIEAPDRVLSAFEDFIDSQ